MNEYENNPIKIAARTDAKSAAGSIATVLKNQGYAELVAIGAAAINQAVKAYIITKGFIAPSNMDICLDAGFDTVMMKNADGKEEERTRVQFTIEPR